MINSCHKFIDEYFERHIITSKLGDGGQGVVYNTEDPDLVIKLVTDIEKNLITDETEIIKHQKKLKSLKILPLPQGIKIAKPIALLKDNPGYVMQLVRGMIPFKHFWICKNSLNEITEDKIPLWLEKSFKENPVFAQTLIHYRNTGGLKRRLLSLTQCASTLVKIHSAGLVYGDISPDNVFISSDLNHNQVWLIDADNLRFEKNKNGGSAFTPSYGAPELMQNTGIGRPRSDCHAFAVMAFYMLSLVHPFLGEATEEDDDWASIDDGDLNNEDKAYQGILPFIDDPDDESNRCSTNQLPRELILTNELKGLFEKNFCDGRLMSWRRPAIYHWPKALAKASDKVIECLNCGMGNYFYSDLSKGNCEYCESILPKKIVCYSHKYVNNGIQSHHWLWAVSLTEQVKVSIPERVFLAFDINNHENDCLKITSHEDRFIIEKSENTDVKLYFGIPKKYEGTLQPFISKLSLSIKELELGLWFYVESKAPYAIKLILEN